MRKIVPKAAISSLKEYKAPHHNALLFSQNEAYLKLDSNEATVSPSPLVYRRLHEFLSQGHLNWYPEASAVHLRKKIASYTNRALEEIQVFNGSDSALDYICRTFVDKDDEVLIASPTYDNFRIYVESLGARVKLVYAKSPFESNVPLLIENTNPDTKLVYICNPNNPTGRIYTVNEVERLLEGLSSGILIIDEAYYEFSKITMTGLLSQVENLIVTRTFSKAFGLAALRCGYALSRKTVLDHINKIRNTKEVNSIAQIAAAAALDDRDYMEAYVKEVHAAKEWLVDRLKSLGYLVFDTPANYILMKVRCPALFITEMKRAKILIRDRSYIPQLESFVRITVGHLKSCRRFVRAIEENGKIRELSVF